MPAFVLRNAKPVAGRLVAAPEALGAADAGAVVAVPELVPRNCHLQAYHKRPIPPIVLEGGTEIIAYVSPDSTYAVTRRLFDAATTSILIGIYDFSAAHMRDLVLAAMARQVKVSLMLDIDSPAERQLFDDLVSMGVTGVSAPSCANRLVHVFRSSHEKVIVIDGEWALVQSGNYSDNSIPLNVVDGGEASNFRTGNRDSGLAVRSAALAKLFTEVLTADMALVPATPELLAPAAEEDFFLVEAAPRHIPATRFASRHFALDAALSVQPVLSPDNYMDVVPARLRQAKRSIWIEQQYVRASQSDIVILLDAIAAARADHPDLEIRILLGKLFKAGDRPKEEQNLALLAQKYGLTVHDDIRYINIDQFVHCHNKMVVIDGEAVLVSSQNWSNAAVSENREAGLLLEHAGIAGYFAAVFESDWKSGLDVPPVSGAGLPEVMTPEALGAGGFVRVERADYEEV